jgi:hypothetical protein
MKKVSYLSYMKQVSHGCMHVWVSGGSTHHWL